MPYMLVNARQTGKTYIITEFCKKEFENYLYVNLDLMENVRKVFETIRNNKIYNSIPAQLGKENKKFKYSLVEKSARAREYSSAMEWLISSNMVLRCQDVTTPKSPLKAYEDENFI